MLTEISLQNFKLFREETRFPLGKITLLTGVNGRGKSTVLQPLLLMRQSVEHDPYTQSILLNGSCVHLGEVRDVKNIDAGEEEEVGVTLLLSEEGNNVLDSVKKQIYQYKIIMDNVSNANRLNVKNIKFIEIINESIYPNIEFEIKYCLLDILKNLYKSSSVTVGEEIDKYSFKDNLKYPEYFDNEIELITHFFNMFPYEEHDFFSLFYYSNPNLFREIHYVSADRLGPQDIYPRSNLGAFVNVGARGEHTATVLAQKQRELVAESLCLGEDARTVLQQTEEWLREIFGGAKLSVEVHRDFVDIGFNTRPDRNRYKPANVGFGYSYILPIIVSGLIAQPGELLIVENPEAHLHPRAQAALTRFLSKVAETGVQVFIESHSEHILNALRIVAKTPDIAISNTDISVLYFQDNDQEPFVPIPILPDGGIETWPQGFFDQTDKDYKELFGF